MYLFIKNVFKNTTVKVLTVVHRFLLISGQLHIENIHKDAQKRFYLIKKCFKISILILNRKQEHFFFVKMEFDKNS